MMKTVLGGCHLQVEDANYCCEILPNLDYDDNEFLGFSLHAAFALSANTLQGSTTIGASTPLVSCDGSE